MTKKKRRDINFFRENRERVQIALYDSGFLKIIEKTDLPLQIEEQKAKEGQLKYVLLDNIPASDNIRPQAWVINMEMDKTIFSSPLGFKTVEKAIVFFTCENLYILMVEMKTTLIPYGESGAEAILKKLKDSISRISVLLTTQIFDYEFNNVKIKYFGLICFNNENWTSQGNQDPQFAKNEVYRVFKKLQPDLKINDSLGGDHKVQLFFQKNTSSNPESMTVDLAEIFVNDDEFVNASYTELTFPSLEILPKAPSSKEENLG
ncbi:MAG: hypothetical protein NW226_14220 [Microscillaceae bacterium]|nr:hypothetical protein [Microscillaceae bacterium]